MRIPIPIRLSQDVVAWIDQQATAADEPRSVVVRRILRRAMEQEQRPSSRRKAQPHKDN